MWLRVILALLQALPRLIDYVNARREEKRASQKQAEQEAKREHASQDIHGAFNDHFGGGVSNPPVGTGPVLSGASQTTKHDETPSETRNQSS